MHTVAAVVPQEICYQHKVAQFLRSTAFYKSRLEILSWYSLGLSNDIAPMVFTVR